LVSAGGDRRRSPPGLVQPTHAATATAMGEAVEELLMILITARQ
jgi:hypothetical protein